MIVEEWKTSPNRGIEGATVSDEKTGGRTTELTSRIGFIQGRLSPIIDGMIQCFPWPYWEEEFRTAGTEGLRLIEWTLDHDRLHENPLMTSEGRERVRALSTETGVRVGTLTGDFFMQAPFHKESGDRREALLAELRDVLSACSEIDVDGKSPAVNFFLAKGLAF